MTSWFTFTDYKTWENDKSDQVKRAIIWSRECDFPSFASDYPGPGGAKFGFIKGSKCLLNDIRTGIHKHKPHPWYETMSDPKNADDHEPMRGVFDIDFPGGTRKQARQVVQTIVDELERSLNRNVHTVIKDASLIGNNPKGSMHLICSNVLFSNWAQGRAWLAQFGEWMKATKNINIDTSIYSSKRQMRLLGCAKGCDPDRLFHLYDWANDAIIETWTDVDWYNSTVTIFEPNDPYVDDETLFVDVDPDIVIVGTKSAERVPRPPGSIRTETDRDWQLFKDGHWEKRFTNDVACPNGIKHTHDGHLFKYYPNTETFWCKCFGSRCVKAKKSWFVMALNDKDTEEFERVMNAESLGADTTDNFQSASDNNNNMNETDEAPPSWPQPQDNDAQQLVPLQPGERRFVDESGDDDDTSSDDDVEMRDVAPPPRHNGYGGRRAGAGRPRGRRNNQTAQEILEEAAEAEEQGRPPKPNYLELCIEVAATAARDVHLQLVNYAQHVGKGDLETRVVVRQQDRRTWKPPFVITDINSDENKFCMWLEAIMKAEAKNRTDDPCSKIPSGWTTSETLTKQELGYSFDKLDDSLRKKLLRSLRTRSAVMDYKPCAHLYSFNNGVWDLTSYSFHTVDEWDPADGRGSPATSYDYKFPFPGELGTECKFDGTEMFDTALPLLIATGYMRYLDYQHFSDDTKFKWFEGWGGLFFVTTDEFNDSEYMMALLGASNTGKSTLIDIAALARGVTNFAEINNETIGSGFSLGKIIPGVTFGARMDDVPCDSNAPIMQRLGSRDPLVINAKNKNEVTMRYRILFVISSNFSGLHWVLKSTSVDLSAFNRRFNSFIFSRGFPLEDTDPLINLTRTGKQEMAALFMLVASATWKKQLEAGIKPCKIRSDQQKLWNKTFRSRHMKGWDLWTSAYLTYSLDRNHRVEERLLLHAFRAWAYKYCTPTEIDDKETELGTFNISVLEDLGASKTKKRGRSTARHVWQNLRRHDHPTTQADPEVLELIHELRKQADPNAIMPATIDVPEETPEFAVTQIVGYKRGPYKKRW